MNEIRSSQIVGDTPPPGLSKEEIADWWRNRLNEEGMSVNRIVTLSDFERKCPSCGDINPCTGSDHCTSCGASLEKSERLPGSNRFNPNQY